MFQQSLRVANLLHVEHDDMAALLGVEGLVQMFEHVLDTELGAVTHSPHAIEFQAVAHAVFLDKHGGSA